ELPAAADINRDWTRPADGARFAAGKANVPALRAETLGKSGIGGDLHPRVHRHGAGTRVQGNVTTAAACVGERPGGRLDRSVHGNIATAVDGKISAIAGGECSGRSPTIEGDAAANVTLRVKADAVQRVDRQASASGGGREAIGTNAVEVDPAVRSDGSRAQSVKQVRRTLARHRETPNAA